MKNTQQTPGQKTGPGKRANTPDERGVEDTKQPAPNNDQYSDDEELSDDFISDDEEE